MHILVANYTKLHITSVDCKNIPTGNINSCHSLYATNQDTCVLAYVYEYVSVMYTSLFVVCMRYLYVLCACLCGILGLHGYVHAHVFV